MTDPFLNPMCRKKIILKKKISCGLVSPVGPKTAKPFHEAVKTGNRSMWAKIFQPAHQPVQTMNFTVWSYIVKSQPGLLGSVDQPT